MTVKDQFDLALAQTQNEAAEVISDSQITSGSRAQIDPPSLDSHGANRENAQSAGGWDGRLKPLLLIVEVS